MKKAYLILFCIVFAGFKLAAQITVVQSGYISLGKGLYFGNGELITNYNFNLKPYGSQYPAFRMLYSNGYIGISRGPSDPQYCLDIGSTIRVNTTTYTSDINLKKDIRIFPPERILGLGSINAVLFKFDENIVNSGMSETDPAFGRDHFGFIAQDIQKVYPELVYTDSLGIMSVDYIGLIPVLIESVKNLTDEIELLKEQIKVMKSTEYQ